MPSRHLAVFLTPENSSVEGGQSDLPGEPEWKAVVKERVRSELTKREREVLTLAASGLNGGEIAERLFISPETVKSHVQNAMGKLGAHTRAHAVAIALVTGEISWEI